MITEESSDGSDAVAEAKVKFYPYVFLDPELKETSFTLPRDENYAKGLIKPNMRLR